LLAPLTALLVVQVTPLSLLASGLDRVLSVVAGVLLAVGFSAVVPLEWWSLGVLIAVSILIGQAMRLGSNLIEVPISAMLVLGVGALDAGAAGWHRITETLIGAGVGMASNLVFPPRIAADDAGNAIRGLADELARLLRHASAELTRIRTSPADAAGAAARWLDDARRATYDIPRVGSALLHAEQGRRLNLRALAAPDVGPGLRQGLEALEHSTVALRSMFRAVLDAVNDPAWPAGEVGDEVLTGLVQLFNELADGVAAFGELVQAEASPGAAGDLAEVQRTRDALEGLREARARLSDLALLDTGPVLVELHVALLTTVKRLLSEMDLDARIRRQLRLLPLPRPRLTRATRRRLGR